MSILLRRLCASSNNVHSIQNTIKSSKRIFMRKANQNEFNTVNSSGIIRLLIKPFVYTVGVRMSQLILIKYPLINCFY